MSNRRKRKSWRSRSWHKEMDDAVKFAPAGLIEALELPDDEKVLLKQVPAKVDDVVVGVANLYDDGSVDFIIDKDAPEEALALIRSTQKEFETMFGYNAVAKED